MRGLIQVLGVVRPRGVVLGLQRGSRSFEHYMRLSGRFQRALRQEIVDFYWSDPFTASGGFELPHLLQWFRCTRLGLNRMQKLSCSLILVTAPSGLVLRD